MFLKLFEVIKKIIYVVRIAKKPSYKEIKVLFKFLTLFFFLIGGLGFLFYIVGILFMH